MRGPRWYAAKKGRRDANHTTVTKGLKALKYFYVDTAGVGDGVLDLAVYDRLNNLHWVELKTPKGKLNDKQRDFIAQLEARGIPWACCRTLDEVLAFVGHDVRSRVEANAARVDRLARQAVAAFGGGE